MLRRRAGDRDPGAATLTVAEPFVVTVHLRLRAPESAEERLADAFMQREQTATVWLDLGGRPSRVAVDVSAENRDGAIEHATGFVRDVCAAHDAACEILSASATTEAERRSLPSVTLCNMDPADPAAIGAPRR